jgi:hypothetical protein
VPRAKNIALWETWDWTLQDITLSDLNNVSRERIRQIRRLLGKPDSMNKKRRRKAVIQWPINVPSV